MNQIETFYLVVGVMALGTGGVWVALKASWSRIDKNDKAANDRMDHDRRSQEEKMNQHYQLLHDRISKHGDQMQGLQIHIAENYVRHDQLDKAMHNLESSVLKEVHAVKDQVELMNKHLVQLIKTMEIRKNNDRGTND